MPLPDASRLATLDAPTWGRLAARLRAIGLGPERAIALSRTGREGASFPRHPLTLWRARRATDPAALAFRLLCIGDAVTAAEAERALGDLLAPCVAAGLVVRDGDALSCPFRLHYANELLLMSDELLHGGDAVMGAGETTGDLARMAYPAQKPLSALDLGCGAGTLALLLAPLVPRVVGTDVNARAIAFARVNAALNGVAGVEWRTGSLFEPVAGDTFDLIVSQPPFIPRHPSARDATFLWGGARGDELTLELLRDLPACLAPGGRAILLVMWPETAEGRIEARVRAAVGDPSIGVTVFAGPPNDLDDWCMLYSMREHPSLGPAFDATVIERREHLERCGITALRMTATVLDRPAHGRGWTAAVPVAMSRLGHAHIDAMLASLRLVAGPPDALLASKLRAPEAATFTERDDGKVHVRFDDESPWSALDVNAVTYALVGALDASPDVRSAVGAMHARTGAPAEKIVAAVEQALAHGVVELAR